LALWLIRKSQIDAMLQDKLDGFEVRLTHQLERLAREGGSHPSPDDLPAIAALAIERARGYGIRTERDIGRFAGLMLKFGRDFDTDPALPFAARIEQEIHVYERSPRIESLLELEPDALVAAGGSGDAPPASGSAFDD
jgi:hypothetical protein